MEGPKEMMAGSVSRSFPAGSVAQKAQEEAGGLPFLLLSLSPSFPVLLLSTWVPRLPAYARSFGVGHLSPGARSFWSRALPPHSAPLP